MIAVGAIEQPLWTRVILIDPLKRTVTKGQGGQRLPRDRDWIVEKARNGRLDLHPQSGPPRQDKRVSYVENCVLRLVVLTVLLDSFCVIFCECSGDRIKSTVLEQVDLGNLPGGRVMKMTLELQPGAEIPPHTHKGPGLRYVLDGAISIAWKDRADTNL